MISQIQHVEIEVDDLAAATDFYTRLGFGSLERPAILDELIEGAWFSVGPTQLHLVLNSNISRPNSSNHIAFAVEDLDAEIARLTGLGIEVSETFDTGAGVQAFFRDPAGNLLEINQP